MPQDGSSEQEVDDPDVEPFIEVDPSGRYGRYKEVLGKGAFKKVYRAFDEWEGIEVAWNQVKVSEIFRNSEDVERLYSEVHLLKTLKHKNIIKFYNSWVDTKNEHINFITEIFTSGNLRQYRKKHKRVELRALKKWSRQILEGLFYLHSHDPPIIHRDLKCDNIFINGNHGEVKIGDLGFAAILRQANAAHSVIGTPEFMAPELYEEDYNELVDIYAFGMCVLELVTFEYPYAECSNAAQIYKKVISGVKPASLVKVRDPSVKTFIEKCIANVSERLSAKELLNDRFLISDDDNGSFARSLSYNTVTSGEDDHQSRWVLHHDNPEPSRDYMVEGERKDANTIFIKLRIADSAGNFRNIHFPYDIEADTSMAVASEMVHELDLTDQDVTIIADMIDSEIRLHIPNWSPLDSFAEESVEAITDTSPWANSSGRKFWLESPRALADDPSSSSYQQQELQKAIDDNVLGCTESEQVRIMADKLEQLLQEQQKELDELRLKHELAVSDLLKELPDKVRCEVLKLCRYKVPNYRMNCETATTTTPQSISKLTEAITDSPTAAKTVHLSKVKNPLKGAEGFVVGPVLRDRLSSFKGGSKSDLGIAVILKDDLEKS